MRPDYFYYQTIKNIISAFGIIFRDVTYVNDWGKEITVPIHYSPREKFITIVEGSTDHDAEQDTSWTLPRFGFELVDIAYDNMRMLNPMSRMQDVSQETRKYMLNRVPYTFTFTLYLAVKKFEDSLKIIEQIVPFFTPDLNISIKDKADFGISTDIPVVLNSVSFAIDYQGGFETTRSITWQLNFMVKGYLYSNVREQKRIKETIVNMTDSDFDRVFESFTSEVIPREAEKQDPHIIIDDIHSGKQPTKLIMDFYSGTDGEVGDTDSGDPATVLNFMSLGTGELARIIESLK